MPKFHTINAPNRPARRAFTLVELMVVILIIVILSSLTLAGLAGVRQRAREDKTKSTIRKIDAVIRPMYDSYRTRRVQVDTNVYDTARRAAIEKLRQLRLLMTREMPESWADVVPGPMPNPYYTSSAAERRYVSHYLRLVNASPRFSETNAGTGTTFGNVYAPAETLHMIVALGGFEPDALEFFRADELGDIDGDGAVEFHDGWGRPIMFVRWPIGHPMPLSMSPLGLPPLLTTYSPEYATGDADTRIADPMDPWKITTTGTANDFEQFYDPALIPLIYSGGPDQAATDPLGTESGLGVRQTSFSWTQTLVDGAALDTPAAWKWGSFAGEMRSNPGDVPGAITNPSTAADNITNYDLRKQ